MQVSTEPCGPGKLSPRASRPYRVEEFELRLCGDTALLSGRARMTGRYAGAPFTAHYRYIDVYVRTDGRWKVCSVQTTRIAK